MIAYWLAALVLLALIVVHLTIGERDVARPLLNSGAFAPDVIVVLFLCWHVVTLVMVSAMAAYVAAAVSPQYEDFALSATMVIGLLALWSFAVVVWKRQRHRVMPQWIAFGVVAILGLAGQLTS